MTDVNRDAIIAQRIEDSTTSVTKTVFPGRTNHHNTLFGEITTKPIQKEFAA